MMMIHAEDIVNVLSSSRIVEVTNYNSITLTKYLQYLSYTINNKHSQ